MIRRTLFSIYDRLKGGRVLGHLAEINNTLSTSSLTQLDSWNNLRRHAVDQCEFYRPCARKLELTDFPVINKRIFKSQFDKFLADSHRRGQLIKMTTSGSTGTPFTVYQDVNKKNRNYADTMYFGGLGGYSLGNRLLYLKIWPKQKMQHRLVYRLRNIVPIDVLHFDDGKIAGLIDDIKKHSSEVHNILGYVSALEQIIRYCEKNNIETLDARFAGVITMSEGLSNGTKLKLEKLFGCSVVSRYSNLENGILAQQIAGEDNRFYINSASYKVEVLNLETDEPVGQGKLGRIIVTDLFNYAMPMIRYDTGDLGAWETSDGKEYLALIEGRKLDMLYNTSGEIVSSYVMYRNMWQYTEINQYQLIQTGAKQYRFKINCPTGFEREAQLVREFKSYLGTDSLFEVEYVNEIPLLQSGKRRKVVNLYRNESV